MTNEITKQTKLQASLEKRGMDFETFRVIKEILYPNVQKEETLLMAIDYCKARNLDIMKRSIQIVPIWDKEKGCMVDTIWPSIAEIRTTATRTKQYAGKSEAEFGNDVTEKLGSTEITYPKWCRITVYRFVAGVKCEFTTKLFWKEAYKSKKAAIKDPNSMWQQRPYAQLEKCVEAAALRSAFPEEIGNDMIAEEGFVGNANEMVDVTNSKTSSLPSEDFTFESEKEESKVVEGEIEDSFDEIKRKLMNCSEVGEIQAVIRENSDFKRFAPNEVKELRSISEGRLASISN